MTALLTAILIFLASHGLLYRPGPRRALEARLGRGGFLLASSALSLALLAWGIAALRHAPVIVLWPQEPWMRLIPHAAMLPATILMAAGMLSPNPLSIGPGARGYDPDHPGILRLTRHPVLWGLTLWAAGHIPPNGDVAALLVFLPLLALALAGPRLLDSSRRRTLGEDEWQRLAVFTGEPLAVTPMTLLKEIGWGRLAAGPALYAALVAAHPHVIGVSPLP